MSNIMNAINNTNAKSGLKPLFYNKLSDFILTHSKEGVLEVQKCHLDLFEMYLDTELASDLELRQKMLYSTICVKELMAIIKDFSDEQIKQESLILAEDE